MSLSGRVALVTGASQGIGHACALKLAQSGAAVAVAARNQEKLNQLVHQIANTGGKAAAFPMDVADEEQIKTAFKAALAQFGKIDILVNNAGITRDQLLMRMKRADWDAVLSTNLTSAYLCIQQAISSMLKQRWGRIINVTSIFGQIGQAGQANYAASKAGLIGLTMAIAREVASVQQVLEPKGFMMSHDEIRVAGWCDACQKTKRRPGELLADNTRRCVEIIRQVNGR